jgi:hypothetical protein
MPFPAAIRIFVPKLDRIMIKPGRLQSILLGILVIVLSACSHSNQVSFQQLISVRYDTLQIDNTRDTLIFGSKGTALFFEKGSFQFPDGTTPSGKVFIRLKECYNNSDIIRENLVTISDGKLLETRGMVNVAAFSNDKELRLKDGKKFTIRFPKKPSDKKTQMSLFYGNANANGTIGWKLDSLTLSSPVAVAVKRLGASDSLEKENYNKKFNKKYKAFKNSVITSIDADELNYYTFSSTKLGWINCDYFWEVKDEKIDYYVKADPKQKPNVKLVFKRARSILAGTLVGDKYVFENVPINQEVKIVAITFEGGKPVMAVANTKTGRGVFDKLDYKPFSISDLERQLNTP